MRQKNRHFMFIYLEDDNTEDWVVVNAPSFGQAIRKLFKWYPNLQITDVIDNGIL